MFVFLMVAGLDLYGLWVLLSKETEQLFTAPAAHPDGNSQVTHASGKPANLVT
jgi:hypothetical protein